MPYGSRTFSQGLSSPLRFHIIMLNIDHTQQIKQQYKNNRRSQKQFIIQRPVRIVRAQSNTQQTVRQCIREPFCSDNQPRDAADQPQPDWNGEASDDKRQK